MDLKKIFENVKSEVLTEEVQEKIQVLVEAKINEAVKTKITELEDHFEDYKEQEMTKLEEKAVAYIDEHLIDQVDAYLDYVAESYCEDNKLAIDNGIKAQLYEKMVKSAKEFLAKNQITESEVEKADDIIKENEDLKAEADKAIKEVIELKKQLKGKEAIATFNEVTSGLTDSQIEKMKELSEDYEVDDIPSFKSKLEILKESISNFSDSEEEKVITEENNNTAKEILEDDDFDTTKILKERKFSSAWDGVENEYL